jgi:hypothetical protein
MKTLATLAAAFLLATLSIGQDLSSVDHRTQVIVVNAESSQDSLPAHYIREAIAASKRYKLARSNAQGFALSVHIINGHQLNAVTFLRRFPNGSEYWIGTALIPSSKLFGEVTLATMEDLATRGLFDHLIPK